MYLGVDYYPEHWPSEMVDEDIKGIKELGANIVRIGEFAWHLMEKEEGKFDFSFFDKIISKLKEENIKVMFGTPTATFPAWLAHKHSTILSEDENGSQRVFGGRRQYCFNSEVYREYSAKITTELVRHYKDEQAIVAWQIDNEFGHEGSDMCYCKQCHKKFQKFLKERYQSIEHLNETYGTIFWGQTYNDFNEIPIPKKTITTHNPALQLDWARFRSYSVNSYAHEQTKLVQKLKGEHQLVTTNVSGGFFDKWFDHEENVKLMDFVSYDNYPVWGGLAEPITPATIAMNHDFNRGLLDKNYWIVEELMGAQGHNVIGYLPRPNQAKMWSYQAFAHGCTDMLYFRWRGMTKGAEQFCYGVVDHDNTYGRKYKEVQSFFNDISKYEEAVKSDINAEVAVLYDYDNIWSWRFQTQSQEFDFTNELMRLYTPFYQFNAKIDVVPITRDFSRYKVLVIPALQIIDEDLGERLKNFTENGGTIIFSFRTGIKDKNNNIHFKKTLPGFVADLAGITISEIESLSLGQFVEVEGHDQFASKKGTCTVWRDIITPNTAKTLFSYADPFYSEAAITKNLFGKGNVYYVGGGIDEGTLTNIVKEIITETGISFIETETGLEVYEREANGECYYFIMNHTAEPKSFGNVLFQAYESKIIKK